MCWGYFELGARAAMSKTEAGGALEVALGEVRYLRAADKAFNTEMVIAPTEVFIEVSATGAK
jgi:hypothetical protein